MGKKVFSSRQVAKIVGADASSVNRWIDSGKLVAYRTPGGHRRVQLRELVAFISSMGMPIPKELKNGVATIMMVGKFTPSIKRAFSRSKTVNLVWVDSFLHGLVMIGQECPDMVVLGKFDPTMVDPVVRTLDAFSIKTLVADNAKPSVLVQAIQEKLNR
jgi:excisionase family DNA binding protein